MPDEAGYSKAFNRAEMGLKSPPRVDNYRGFIFVSFNPAVEDLVTYLAGARITSTLSLTKRKKA